MNPSDEIKQKLDIVDVLKDYIQLTAAGVNFKARCPFHNEKTPSLMVSPEKQIWHCFGCGKGGDIFEFVKEMEGVEFVEALRILAPKAGVVLKRQDPKLQSERNRLLDILEWSRKFFHQGLLKSPKAAAARQYLAERGLKEETIEEWQIGYSPDDWEILKKFLIDKGFKEEEIFKSGMIVKSQKGSRHYDRFRDRIMFPIQDMGGNTVAFTARVNPAKEESEVMGKYINSPQTLIYDKSKIIYGLDKAKRHIREQDLVILVEGQMDVISAHQAGYRNVVASSGTALTKDQVAMLKRYTNNLGIAFDMDEAGVLAADRGIREALNAEMNIKVITVPDGKDPDECIRRDPRAWEQAVAQARPMMDYYFDQSLSAHDNSSAEGKRAIAKKLLPIIGRLSNRIEKDHYLRELANTLEADEQILREAINQPVNTASVQKQGTARTADTSRDPAETTSELVLALIFKYPVFLDHAIRHLQVSELKGEKNKELYRNLVLYYNNVITAQTASNENGQYIIDYNDFIKWLDQQAADFGVNETQTDSMNPITNQQTLLNRLVFLADRDYYQLDQSEIKQELWQLIRSLKRRYLSVRMKEVERMIADLENQKQTDEANALMGELKMLSDEFKSLE